MILDFVKTFSNSFIRIKNYYLLILTKLQKTLNKNAVHKGLIKYTQ